MISSQISVNILSSHTKQIVANTCRQSHVKVICQLALRTFIEISISFAYVHAASYFVTAHALPVLVLKTSEYLLKSIYARTWAALFQYGGELLTHSTSSGINSSKADLSLKQKYLSNALLNTSKIFHYVAMMYFLKIDHHTQQTIVHECGHALAGKLLFSQPETKITLIPYRNGHTETQYYGLSRLGNYFGKDMCKVLVTLSGPFFAIFCASIQIMIAQRLKANQSKQVLKDKEFKNLTSGFSSWQIWLDKLNQWIPFKEFALGRNSIAVEYLEWSALSNIFKHLTYAAQPLGPSKLAPTHDFAILAAAGIHPIAAMVGIVALPIFAYTISKSC